jgi:intraflagellar transport protein 20
MDDKVRITFDQEYKLRVLDPSKFEKAEKLEKECSSFVEKISSFNEKVTSLVEVLDCHANRIDAQKLRVGCRFCYFIIRPIIMVATVYVCRRLVFA